MKTTMLALVTTLFLATANAEDDNYTPPEPTGTNPGRFQLLAGTITTDDASPKPVVMRIDTATGQVWIYQQMSYSIPRSGGKTILTAGWVATTENILKSIETNKRIANYISTNTPAKGTP